MCEGCSIADRAAPASQLGTSYSPATALQDGPVGEETLGKGGQAKLSDWPL